MPMGIAYTYTYMHKRKEVAISLQVGSTPPFEFVMGAEGFIQDIEFIIADGNLAKFLAAVKERKDLPIDHKFGAGGSDLKQWDKWMEEKP